MSRARAGPYAAVQAHGLRCWPKYGTGKRAVPARPKGRARASPFGQQCSKQQSAHAGPRGSVEAAEEEFGAGGLAVIGARSGGSCSRGGRPIRRRRGSGGTQIWWLRSSAGGGRERSRGGGGECPGCVRGLVGGEAWGCRISRYTSASVARGDFANNQGEPMAKTKKPRSSAPDPPAGAAHLPWHHPPAPPVSTALLISLAALLLRVLVSVGPYSGQGVAPKFGDYEAQRHWMELTLHLPSSDWYRNTSANDLAYWGLDYPPLSAYQSRLHGLLLNASLPDAVALRSSRGFESPESKLLMRWTVLSSDLMVFFPAALWFVWVYFKCGVGGTGEEGMSGWTWLLASCLINPCLVLIDHGHFQYNCISLGLTLGAIAGVLSGNELVAAALFSLSINHKQMSLYFAPAFFGHLLGKCIKRKYPIVEVMKLGFVVLGTFALVWWPFLHSYEAAMQVISRLAPFERVLIKWKRLFAIKPLKLMSLSATILAFLPSLVQQVRSPSNLGFLYSLLNSSISFYLFSYQVHEKSILLPLLPASLLALQEPHLYGWLMYFGLFSMYPLICRDHLLLQYIAVLGLFILIYYSPGGSSKKGVSIPSGAKAVLSLALLCSLLLKVLYLQIEPPKRYPFLFDALIMFICFSQFVILTLYTNYKQWMLNSHSRSVGRKKDL
uniref:Alpha-1,3-glucosyltransferase n=1 Tax=Oryza barthii TaxID=65489 RepID=A0A0D3GMM6_9ORYZ